MKTRNVTVLETVYLSRELGYKTTEKHKGVFHGFGVDYEDLEPGPGNYSIAIVELPDGTVITPRADKIRFDN